MFLAISGSRNCPQSSSSRLGMLARSPQYGIVQSDVTEFLTHFQKPGLPEVFHCPLEDHQLRFNGIGVHLRGIDVNFFTLGGLIVGGCFPIFTFLYFKFATDFVLTIYFIK